MCFPLAIIALVLAGVGLVINILKMLD
jgi:hypothetical protein